MTVQRVGVIGAGVVGLAVARRLARLMPDACVTVLDKEDSVAAHQTGRNSGVVHAGLYYAPGSLKATLCRRGMSMLKEYCQEKEIAYDECGKLVVAVDAGERPALERIRQRATENQVPGLRSVTAAEIRELEPHSAGIAGLHSPKTAITDFVTITQAYANDVVAAGGSVRLGTPVTGIAQARGAVQVMTDDEQLEFDQLVICAGLQSDTVARWAGDDAEPAIMPFRGEYMMLVPEKTDLVNGLIYPVPDPNYPFLGVHFTRHVGGYVDAGRQPSWPSPGKATGQRPLCASSSRSSPGRDSRRSPVTLADGHRVRRLTEPQSLHEQGPPAAANHHRGGRCPRIVRNPRPGSGPRWFFPRRFPNQPFGCCHRHP
jgi:L-2-hydroxyglutarate oxidase LhgO